MVISRMRIRSDAGSHFVRRRRAVVADPATDHRTGAFAERPRIETFAGIPAQILQAAVASVGEPILKPIVLPLQRTAAGNPAQIESERQSLPADFFGVCHFCRLRFGLFAQKYDL